MESLDFSRTVRSLSLKRKKSYRIQHFPLKRAFDLAFSFLFLTFFSPFFLILALSIRISSHGRAIYSHERIGRGGKAFKCYKFRTMYEDAESRLEALLRSNPTLREEWNRSFKLKNDPRITPFGRFLRKTSLDELPQFWNVFKGDLSIVGPRPVVQEELNHHFGVKAYKILSIRPGLTGLWQVSGRSDTSYETRIRLDETYVDTQSFFLDLKLILKTIPCMICLKGAY